jgi:hypothetical protein
VQLLKIALINYTVENALLKVRIKHLWVTDSKSLAPHYCGFESYQGVLIPTDEGADQVALGKSVSGGSTLILTSAFNNALLISSSTNK